jgi:transposase
VEQTGIKAALKALLAERRFEFDIERTDVKTLLPIVARLQKRFNIVRVCIVADRGMFSAETLRELENPDNTIAYILGTRMHKVKEIRDIVLSHTGRYKKELERHLSHAGHIFEWDDIKQDLKALQQVTIEEGGKQMATRSKCKGVCGKVFQAVGVAMPPTIREL